MTLRSFRDKVRWLALVSAVILFSLDIYCRTYCSRIVISSNGVPIKLDTSPRGFIEIWLSALVITLLSGLITLPRWQSFLALFTAGLVIFLSVVSGWPGASQWFN